LTVCVSETLSLAEVLCGSTKSGNIYSFEPDENRLHLVCKFPPPQWL